MEPFTEGELTQMNTLPDISNTKPDGPRADSDYRNQSIVARYQFWRMGIVCLAVVFSWVGCDQPASAHQGFDPEIAELTEDLATNPESVDLLIRRGQVYRSYGKYSKSLTDLDQAWLLDPNNEIVAIQRGLTLSAMRQNKEAEETFNFILQKTTGQKRAMVLTERAAIRARTGRPKLAIKDFSAVLVIQQTAELYLMRGKLQESLGRLEEAAAGYHEGITKLGNSVLLKKRLIEIRIAQGQFNQAIGLIDEQISRAQVKMPWLLQRANVLTQMGQSDLAGTTYKQALSEANRVVGKRRTALSLLARAKILNAMGHREKAMRDLQDALKKSPRFAEAKNLLQTLRTQ